MRSKNHTIVSLTKRQRQSSASTYDKTQRSGREGTYVSIIKVVPTAHVVPWGKEEERDRLQQAVANNPVHMSLRILPACLWGRSPEGELLVEA